MKKALAFLLLTGCTVENYHPTPQSIVIGTCPESLQVTSAHISSDVLYFTCLSDGPVDVMWNGLFVNTQPRKIKLHAVREGCSEQTGRATEVRSMVSLSTIGNTDTISIMIGPFVLKYPS